jgi:HEAT repeat protein
MSDAPIEGGGEGGGEGLGNGSSDDDLQPEPPPPASSPYRNLFVPLIVVPFLVVGVLVLVFVFFGAIRGRDATLSENLERAVHGGSKEREQAAVSLVAQAVENSQAQARGDPYPWKASPSFVSDLQEAWRSTEGDDALLIRLALAQLSAQFGDPEAFEKLAWFLELSDAQDPEGKLRGPALVALSWLGDPRAAERVIPYLRHADPYLRQSAAAALQRLPGPATVEALRAALDDPSLEFRGMAAISLSHLGDPSGSAVLRELVDPATFAAEHEREPRKWAGGELIQQTRLQAVRALGRLEREEDRALLRRLADGDEDPAVREAAMRALEAGARAGGGSER